MLRMECQMFAIVLKEWKLIKYHLIKWRVVLWNAKNGNEKALYEFITDFLIT